MTTMECDFATDVIRAVKSSQWTEELRNHAAGCPRCRETAALASLMAEVADAENRRTLPDYRTVWLKARYVRREERLSRLDLITLAGLLLGGIAGLALLLMLTLPQMARRVLDISNFSFSHMSSLASGGTPFLALAGVALMIWLLTRDWKVVG